jgi:hypothetical protein
MQATMRGRTAAMADAVAHAFNLYQAGMAATVAVGANPGTRMGRLTNLLIYLNTAEYMGPTPRARALVLHNWNEAFGLTQNTLAEDGEVAGRTIREIVTEIYDTGTVVAASFVAFCAAGGAPHPSERVGLMRTRLRTAGLAGTSVYNLIHVFHQHALGYAHLTELRAVDLYRLNLGGHGPGAAFPGFADWGPGNSGGIAENKRAHFDKHVLDRDPAPLAWKEECPAWWQALDIALTKEILAARVPADIFNRVQNLFPPPNNARLSNHRVVDFLGVMRTFNGWDARLLDWFRTNYEAPYAALAVNGSQNMTDIMVHTTAGGALMGVFISGRFNDFFIVGRLEGLVLGISSCYVAEDMGTKLAARVQIWPLA